MKLQFSLGAFAPTLLLFFLAGLGNVNAQRYLSERKPDLTVVSTTIKKDGVDQLNVIWSIKNLGDADARLVGLNREPLVSYLVEGSNKKEAAGVAHQWREVSRNVPLVCSKEILKPGESVSGTFRLPYIEQESLVSYRLSLETESALQEQKKENNSIIAILIGL